MLRSAAALVLLVLGTAACTTVPTKEFATYKETFAKARAAGEDVLLDYGASARQNEEFNVRKAAAKPVTRLRGQSFDPTAVGKNGASVDHVLVRMKAWEVIARYNDLLTKLAEGRAADELAGAVDSLSASLTSFPIAAVAATAAEVSGYLAPLKPLALEAVREQSRRQFVAAVGKGAPLINDRFVKLLRDETVNFYQVRWGLNDREMDPLTDQAIATSSQLTELAGRFQTTPKLEQDAAAINASVAQLPMMARDAPLVAPLKLPRRGTAPLTPEAKAQIELLADDLKATVAKVAAKDDELAAYRKVLDAYVTLLNQLEHSMRALQAAAEQAQPGIPPSDELQRVVVLLRQAYISYKDKGKE